MYVPLQVNRFHESILLLVQYKYLKSCSGDFDSPESDPPHKIMRDWIYYSIWLGFSFPPDHDGLVEMICTTVVPASKGHLEGAALKYVYMIHRVGWKCTATNVQSDAFTHASFSECVTLYLLNESYHSF